MAATWTGLLLAWTVCLSLGQDNFDYEAKKTYCERIAKTRLYKKERLEFFCALKVRVENGQVCTIFYSVFLMSYS